MKKIILLTMMVLASCSEPKTPEVEAGVVDSTKVAVDTMAVVTESAAPVTTAVAVSTVAPK